MRALILSRFWTDPDTEPLSRDEKLAAFWLMTNPSRNSAGITDFTERRFTFETDLEPSILDTLIKKVPSFAIRDGNTFAVLKFIRIQYGSGRSLTENNWAKRVISDLRACSRARIVNAILKIYPELQPLMHGPCKTASKDSKHAHTDKPFPSPSQALSDPSSPLVKSCDSPAKPSQSPHGGPVQSRAVQSSTEQSSTDSDHNAETPPPPAHGTPRQTRSQGDMPGLGETLDLFAKNHPDISPDTVTAAWHALEATMDAFEKWVYRGRPCGNAYSALLAEVQRLRGNGERGAVTRRISITEAAKALEKLLETHPGNPKVNTDPSSDEALDFRKKTRELRIRREQLATVPTA